MKSFGIVLGLVLAVLSSAQEVLKCNANNCLRAVRATDRPERSATISCSSFLRHTLTPATVTHTDYVTEYTFTQTAIFTSSVTVTTTVELPGLTVYKRQATVIPTAIPPYASACSGAVGYSSACLCIGVTPTTVTVAAPSTTVTITKYEYTATQTRIIASTIETVATVTATRCALQIQTGQPGKYVRWTHQPLGNSWFWGVTDTIAQASQFVLQPDGRLFSVVSGTEQTVISYLRGPPSNEESGYMTSAPIRANHRDTVICAFDSNNQLYCNHPAGPIDLMILGPMNFMPANTYGVFWYKDPINYENYDTNPTPIGKLKGVSLSL